MDYEASATSLTPALIVYLLDVSGSMRTPMSNGQTRIEVLRFALRSAAKQMIGRATKGSFIAPRYRVAMYAYTDEVYDVLKGIQTIDTLAKLGTPELKTMNKTNTAEGFRQVKKLLLKEIPKLPPGSPAPLVCHMTDGEYTAGTDDPEGIVREIQRMRTPDGNVLVENIFVSEKLAVSTKSIATWPGYLPGDPVGDRYGAKLLAMSSPLPESYRLQINELGFHIQPGTLMMYPGIQPEFVQLAFVMSTMTKVAEAPRTRAYQESYEE